MFCLSQSKDTAIKFYPTNVDLRNRYHQVFTNIRMLGNGKYFHQFNLQDWRLAYCHLTIVANGNKEAMELVLHQVKLPYFCA